MRSESDFDYADFVLTRRINELCACMYVVYMKQSDEVSRVVKALPQAISLDG